MNKITILDEVRTKKVLNLLLDDFEEAFVFGQDVGKVAHNIYKELIEGGLLPSEVKDRNITADILLVGIKYEFADEYVLELLLDILEDEAKLDVITG